MMIIRIPKIYAIAILLTLGLIATSNAWGACPPQKVLDLTFRVPLEVSQASNSTEDVTEVGVLWGNPGVQGRLELEGHESDNFEYSILQPEPPRRHTVFFWKRTEDKPLKGMDIQVKFCFRNKPNPHTKICVHEAVWKDGRGNAIRSDEGRDLQGVDAAGYLCAPSKKGS